MTDFLDEDIAYLLGMISVRGKLIDSPPNRAIQIEIPYTLKVIKGLKKTYDRDVYMKLEMYEFRQRIEELLATTVNVTVPGNIVYIVANFPGNSIAWRNLKKFLISGTNSINFHIPKEVLDSPETIKKSFIRGVADAAGGIDQGGAHPWNHKRRVIIAINGNWHFPIELCNLLQQDLKIPVNGILWGHPNIRDPQASNSNIGIREHQFRVYAEAFLPVGFDISYKAEMLKEFAEDDIKKNPGPTPFCYPDANENFRQKSRHPKEKSSLIPASIRGKHFNSCREICRALGCKQTVQQELGLILEEVEAYEDEGKGRVRKRKRDV
jgi:hypothetical protein